MNDLDLQFSWLEHTPDKCKVDSSSLSRSKLNDLKKSKSGNLLYINDFTFATFSDVLNSGIVDLFRYEIKKRIFKNDA